MTRKEAEWCNHNSKHRIKGKGCETLEEHTDETVACERGHTHARVRAGARERVVPVVAQQPIQILRSSFRHALADQTREILSEPQFHQRCNAKLRKLRTNFFCKRLHISQVLHTYTRCGD